MKRQQLIKELRKIAKAKGLDLVEVREGGNHTIFDLGGQGIPVPRHAEINENLARKIIKEASK